MGKHLTEGAAVIIAFEPHDICVVDDMRQYNGLETNVSKVHISKTIGGRQFSPQYELKGVVSTIGKIPYTFTRDMIIDATDVTGEEVKVSNVDSNL